MIEQPQFRTVLRGFDPDQVKAALEEMQNALSTARRIAADRTIELTRMQEKHGQIEKDLDEAAQRIADLERHGAAAGNTNAPADVGARIGSILALANEEAEELRAGGREQAQRQLDEASAAIAVSRAELERYAEGVRTNAHAQAGQVVEEARRTASEILAHATHEAQARRAEAEAIVENHRAQAAAVAEFGDQIALHADRLRLATARVEQLAQEEATLIERQSQESRDRIQRDSEHQLAAVDARRDSIKSQLATVGALLHELGSAVGVAPQDLEVVSAADGRQPTSEDPAADVQATEAADLVEVTEQAFDRPDENGAAEDGVTDVHDAEHDTEDESFDEDDGIEDTEPSAAQELADWVGEGGAEDVDSRADREEAGARR
ncbi:MAG TPA: hypothetical protein VFR40_15965 [Lapillicoccus sp.]|nr:hypothetical protein [Lapillicoccus sp.]